jgi:hypothetical protein
VTVAGTGTPSGPSRTMDASLTPVTASENRTVTLFASGTPGASASGLWVTTAGGVVSGGPMRQA